VEQRRTRCIVISHDTPAPTLNACAPATPGAARLSSG
jgi:hypothetical protein